MHVCIDLHGKAILILKIKAESNNGQKDILFIFVVCRVQTKHADLKAKENLF